MKKPIFCCLLAASAVPAAAQVPDASDIETIQVTALRTPRSVVDVATTVTILDADDLAVRQTFSLPELLNTLPGISVARAGSVGGQAQLRLRGGEANQTLVLIDGIQMNDPAAGDEVQFELISATEIERIEVVRGPLSSVWGSDAVSGVINIITKRGDGDMAINANGEAGAFSTYRFGGSIAGGSEREHFRLGASYSDSDGTNASRTGDEKDGYRALTVNGTAGFKLGDSAVFDLSLRHNDARNEFDTTDFSTGLPADADRVTDTKKTYAAAGAEFLLFGGRAVQSARVTYLDTEIANRSDGVASGTTAAERWGFYLDTRVTLLQGHTLTLAFDHEDTDFSQRGIASFFGDPNQDQSRNTTGYVADYVGNLTPELTVTGSVRFDDHDRFEDFTSWRAGLVYKLNEGATRFYANAARGQKAPTFLDQFGFFSDQFQGNPDLIPENSLEYEIGFTHALMEGRVTLGASAFTARLEDEINGFAFDPVTFLFTAVNRDGESKRDGFELTADIAPRDDLSLQLSYSYVDAEEPAPGGGFQREVRRPKHNASLFMDWRPTDALGLTLDATYVGEAVDTFFPPFPEPSRQVTLDNYLLVTVAASYRISEQVSLTGRVENLLDESYENVFGFATPGIGAYGGVRVSF